MVDALLGLIVVGVLAVVIATAVRWERRASDGLADARAATTAAERALVDLAQGRRIADAAVQVDPLAGGADVAGHHWVRVTATVDGHRAALVGLARDGTGAQP
jgi:hypothetical protein